MKSFYSVGELPSKLISETSLFILKHCGCSAFFMKTVILMNGPFSFFLSSVLIFQDKRFIVFKNVYELVITNHNCYTADNQLNAKPVVKQRYPGDEFPVSL